MGLYNYDPTIFDNMHLPPEISKDDLVNNILAETAELEVVYSNPIVMKTLIGSWSKSRLNAWTRIAEVLAAEYKPLYNKLENITETDTYGPRHSTATQNIGAQTGSNEAVNGVSGFNEINSAEAGKTTTTGTQGAREDNGSSNADGYTDLHSSTSEGTIGVITTQDMITREVALRVKQDIYEIIQQEFKLRFCLLVY